MIKAVLLRNNNANAFIRFLVETKQTFDLSASNYTTKIEGEVITQKWVKHMQSKRTFAAYSKLKKDVKDQPVPVIDRDQLVYYVHNFREDSYTPQVFNIDLKSAYATILLNDGMITPDTYIYLSKLQKQERLASVGMLATCKQNFKFIKGEPVELTTDVSQYSGFFFYAVKRTSEIMDELKKICGQKYLFTWVDGIYFLPDETIFSNCCEYLDQINFPYTCEYLTDFTVRQTEIKVSLVFKKQGKIKVFNLPHATTDFKKVVVSSIQLLNQKKKPNEKGKTKPTKKQGRRVR
jgi:hypothetical protein